MVCIEIRNYLKYDFFENQTKGCILSPANFQTYIVRILHSYDNDINVKLYTEESCEPYNKYLRNMQFTILHVDLDVR